MKRRMFIAAMGMGALGGCTKIGGLGGTPTSEPEVVAKYDTPSPTPTPVARVTSIAGSVKIEGGFTGAYLSVRLEAEVDRTGLTLLLSDVSGETFDEQFLSERKLLDGVETVRLDLPDPVPPGEFSVQVVRGDSWGGNPTLVAEQTISLSPPEVSLRDVDIEAEQLRYSDGYTMTSAAVTVANTAGMPVEVTDVSVAVGGERAKIESHGSTVIAVGESERFSTTSSLYLPSMEAGTNMVTMTAYSGDKVLAEKTIRVVL